VKKLEKNKLSDLDESKNEVHDLCCALKKYLSSLPEPLIPYRIVDQFCIDCDKLNDRLLREKVRQNLETIPKKNAVYLLLAHLRKVVQHERENRMSPTIVINIWTATLMNPNDQHYKEKLKKNWKFFEILMSLNEIDNLPDLLPDRVRESKYDNVPDDIEDVRGEADILEEKTATKL